MAVKRIILPDGTHRLFGRRTPTKPTARLRLRNYLIEGASTPPAACGYTYKARPQVHQMYGNDALGDCVEAAVGHTIGVFGANAGAWWTFTTDQIIEMYSQMGGYIPGNETTDNGTDIAVALSIWERVGVTGPGGNHKIAGALSVNAADPEECRQAIWLFENLILGLDLPDAWINPFPSDSGFVWDFAGPADPNNGHCVVAAAYDPASVYIATWGLIGGMTNAALAEYCVPSSGGELYVVLSKDILYRATQRSPGGLNWAQLLSDFAAL